MMRSAAFLHSLLSARNNPAGLSFSSGEVTADLVGIGGWPGGGVGTKRVRMALTGQLRPPVNDQILVLHPGVCGNRIKT